MAQPARFYKQNRMQQLRGFYHVAATGSFSAAAEYMSLGQPAVTLQVQALERELKARVFERKRGSVALTFEGRILFELAAPLVEALESLDDAFRERLGRSEAGQVTCAAPDSIIYDVLPALVGKSSVRYPNIDLVIYSCTSLQAVEMVARGDVEIGIGAVRDVPRHIRYQPLIHRNSFLVVPKDHPLAEQASVTLEEIAAYPLIAPTEEGVLWQSVLHEIKRHGLHPHVNVRLASTEARLRYVELGFGITVATERREPSDVARRLVWIRLPSEAPATTYGLITRKNTYLSFPAKRMTEFILEMAPAFSN